MTRCLELQKRSATSRNLVTLCLDLKLVDPVDILVRAERKSDQDFEILLISVLFGK